MCTYTYFVFDARRRQSLAFQGTATSLGAKNGAREFLAPPPRFSFLS